MAMAGALPPNDGMAIKTISSLLIDVIEKSFLGSVRSITVGWLDQLWEMMEATFSVPPVGLKMISTVFISFSFIYSSIGFVF